jgi:ArsR family transcriptional regulator, cadmium/lead-responsive transcriptional repressor
VLDFPERRADVDGLFAVGFCIGGHLASGGVRPCQRRPRCYQFGGGRYHRHMAMISVDGTARAALAPAAALFRSLGDSTRLAIVRRLAETGEARVVDLVADLGLAQSTVSDHLACLRDCQLVDWRAEGRQSFYSLTRPELIDLLASAEQLLDATGNAVALCPVYGKAGADAAGALA